MFNQVNDRGFKIQKEVYNMAALFTAADVTGLAGNVSTMLVAFVGVTLLFTGYRYVKKGLNRG